MDYESAHNSRFAAFTIYFDIDNDANVGTREFVMDIAETATSENGATAPAIPNLVRFPFRYLPQPSQEFCAAWIVYMLEAKFQSVGAAGCNNLVQERLVRERVLHAPWRTDPRWAQRR